MRYELNYWILFRYQVLLPEGRAGEAWKPSKKVTLRLPPPPTHSSGVSSAFRYTPSLSLS
jgi:hypothetical protein